MAKGNNGNLLQHFVEAELTARLTEPMLEKRLYAVFTHGMAPFEKFEPLTPGEPDDLRRLLPALTNVEDATLEELEFPVLPAYKKLNASEESFPNSAEVVSAVLGEKAALSGQICEMDATLAGQLKDVWQTSSVTVRPGSWRDAVRYIGASETMEIPWIFSMDPYTYKEREFMDVQDDGALDQNDWLTLQPILSGHFNTGQRGVVAIFSYGMERQEALSFESAIIDFCKLLGEKVHFEVSNCFLPTASHDGKEHVCALIAEDWDLIESIRMKWSNCLPAVRGLI